MKRKCELNKVFILVLTVNKTLKNAQKILFEKLKVAKTEHTIIQNLINQIERARIGLDLKKKAFIIIDQVHKTKDF